MTLKGEKTILRPMRIEDAPVFLKWVNDPETSKLLAAREKKLTLKEEKNWINNLIKKKENGKIQFAVETKDGRHIGSAGFHWVDKKNKSASFGILIGDKEFRGKGYGKDVSQVLINYAFGFFKLNRIQLEVFEYNKKAQNLYKKIGFKKEGIKREAVFYKGKFHNEHIMSLLRKEWKNKKI